MDGCVCDAAHAAETAHVAISRHAVAGCKAERAEGITAGSEARKDEQTPGAERVGGRRAHRDRVVGVDAGAQYASE